MHASARWAVVSVANRRQWNLLRVVERSLAVYYVTATPTAPEFPNSTAELFGTTRTTLLSSSGTQEQGVQEGRADRTESTRS